MFYGWTIVGITAITLLFSFGFNVSIGAFFGSFSEDFAWSQTSMALAVSLNMLTWGFLQPIMGKCADKYGPKKILLLGVSIMGVSMILCSTISSLWELFLYYGIFTAIGFSAAGSLVNSVLITRWFKKKKGTAMSLSTIGINAGQFLVLLFVGYSLHTNGWRDTFMTMGIAMLIVVVPILLFALKNNPSEKQTYIDGEKSIVSSASIPSGYLWKEAVRTRDFWLLSTSFMGCGFTLYLMVAHLPSFALDLGASKQTAASLLGIAGAASIIGTLAMGTVSDKIGSKKPLLMAHLLRTISFVILFFAATISTLQWTMILYGFASFTIIPLITTFAANRFGTTNIGAIMGSVWMLHQLSAAIGVFLGGVIRDWTGSYHTVYLVGAIVLLISTILTIGLTETKKPTYTSAMKGLKQ